jgi:hypothetical protein
MSNSEWTCPPFSRRALLLFGFLERNGGCVRARPLVEHCPLPVEALAAAVEELNERAWIKVTRRALRPDLPEPFRDIDRITIRPFGRFMSRRLSNSY